MIPAEYETKTPLKLQIIFSKILTVESESVRQRFVDLMLAVIALNGYKSIRQLYKGFIKPQCRYSLNTLCYAIKSGDADIETWMQNVVKLMLSLPQRVAWLPIQFSIDDTLIEKKGDKFDCLEIVCAIRSDTVLYELPPERNGRRGRPKKYGDVINIRELPLTDVENKPYRATQFTAIAKVFGDKPVLVTVTEPKSGGKRRLFISTCSIDATGFCPDSLPAGAKDFSNAGF